MYDLKLISQMVKASITNAVSLLEEAKILADNNKIERAFFLTIIAIEEMGKATMYNNSVQYGKNNSLFQNKFNNFKTKHAFKIFKSIIFKNNMQMNLDYDFSDIEVLAKEIDSLKMSSLYVDLKNGNVISPVAQIKVEDFLAMYEFASQIMNHHLYILENGFYEVEFYKQVKEFYSDDNIQSLQEKLFKGELSREEYLTNLIEQAILKENNVFAKFLISSLYLSLNNIS